MDAVIDASYFIVQINLDDTIDFYNFCLQKLLSKLTSNDFQIL